MSANGNDPKVTELHISGEIALEAPQEVIADYPTTAPEHRSVARFRKEIENIMRGNDGRFLIIAGPCSIFNKRGALEFARKFRELAVRVGKTILLIMRSPPDKPRSISKAGQWEGSLHEPEVVGEHNPILGIRRTREILCEIVKMDVGLALELLDSRRTNYFDDLLSFSWTGARAVEYGALRRQASGLDWPVGFKNRTDGALKPAFDAIESANHPNYYDGMNKKSGQTVVKYGTGNEVACLIMRGSENAAGRNYNREHVEAAQRQLRERKLLTYVIVDSAHGNSLDDNGKKDHQLQLKVFNSTLQQWLDGNKQVGAMVEAYLKEGRQDVRPGTELASLPYDISPTDPTISFEQLEALVLDADRQIRSARDPLA